MKSSLLEISQEDQVLFDKFISNARKKFIFSPKETVKNLLKNNYDLISDFKNHKNASNIIKILRTESFNAFLAQESEMNSYILRNLSDNFKVPALQFERLFSILNDDQVNSNWIQFEFKNKLKSFFGTYVGTIYPYFYRLSLSNTQSRRSRSGKIFEGIMYGIYEVLNYQFDAQSIIGSQNFKSKKLGKLVDSIIPNLEAFNQRRDKVIIGTMKATLRERWQEVIEEISRTGLPCIYLLTVDDNIALSKVDQMANHNVILVVYQEVKNTEKLKNKRNVLSFENFLFEEIVEILNYWKK